jgi:hypothetical protein
MGHSWKSLYWSQVIRHHHYSIHHLGEALKPSYQTTGACVKQKVFSQVTTKVHSAVMC